MPRKHTTGSVRTAILPGLDFDEPLDGERWLPVKDWPGYEVSDWGRVRSYFGLGRRTGNIPRLMAEPRIIRGGAKESGHRFVNLVKVDGSERAKGCYVHILVLEAFVCPRPAGREACHNDSDPANNRLGNLRWDTPSGNWGDRYRHGTATTLGLAIGDVSGIWTRLVNGDAPAVIARDYRVPRSLVSDIKRNKRWAHVTSRLPGWPIYLPESCLEDVSVRVPPELADPAVEIWRPIPGWPAYRVSNRGEVASCWVSPGRGRLWVMGEKWRTLRPLKTRGALRVCVTTGRAPGKYIGIHRIVLEAFAGPCPAGLIACHNDGDHTNNHAANLRWDTYRSNSADRFRHARERLASTGT